MHYTFRTRNVCSAKIDFDIEDGILHNVVYTGGCNGNLKALSKLVEGKPVDEIKDLLAGNTCGFKDTSCADQLSQALAAAQDGRL